MTPEERLKYEKFKILDEVLINTRDSHTLLLAHKIGNSGLFSDLSLEDDCVNLIEKLKEALTLCLNIGEKIKQQ